VKSAMLLFLKGIAMGMADAVPGVSGGTIAVITRVYEKLIFSISAVDATAIRLLFSGRVNQLWIRINGTFLALLAAGVLTGLLISANTVLFLLTNHFELLMAFFIGLVLASAWLLKSKFDCRDISNLGSLVIGIIITLLVSVISPNSMQNASLFYIFLSGWIAICAMILPGISGAFVLLIFGVYETLLTALIEINLLVITVFGTACIGGLISFSRIISWVLKHHYEKGYSFLIGMLMGSIYALWPWKITVNPQGVENSGETILQTSNTLPLNYKMVTGNDPLILGVLLSVIAGLTLILVFNKLFASKAG
jgi:putative membrane protein